MTTGVEKRKEQTLWQKIKGKLSVVEPGTTPPNWACISVMFVALFSSAFSLCFLLPFLPEMILTFGYTEEEKGYYVGIIASSVFAGRAVGSYFWGYLSDIKGRRLILLISIVLNGIFCAAFGFSTNMAMAISFRFLAGALNGIVGTAKAVLYEVSDNTNQAIGMSTISLAWGFGLIMGPSLGGWLASPAKKYPHLFDEEGFLGMFPYFLPSITCFAVSLFAFTVVFFKFKETRNVREMEIPCEDCDDIPMEKISLTSQNKGRSFLSLENLTPSKYPALSVEDLHNETEAATFKVHQNLQREADVRSLSSRESLKTHSKLKADMNRTTKDEIIIVDKTSELLLDKSQNNTEDFNIEKSENGCHSETDKLNCSEFERGSGSQMDEKKTSCCSRFCSRIANSNPVILLSTRDVRNTILLYTVYSFAVIGMEDVFTIWASTEPRLDGLGFNTSEIGTILGAVAIPLLLIQIKIYPLIVNRLGIKKSFIVFNFVLLISIQILPVLHLIYDRKKLLWACLILILLAEKLGANCCFSGSSLLINNSCQPNMVGKVNGLAMTFTAIARTIAPTVGGSLFAWSVGYGSEHIGAPFDINLSFIFFGLAFMASCIQCIFLPNYLNNQRRSK